MLCNYCDNPAYRCQYIAGPFNEWNLASHFVKGYIQARKELGIKTPGSIEYVLLKDVKYDSDLVGFNSNVDSIKSGFYVVRKTELTKAESAELTKQKLKIKANLAMKNAEEAFNFAQKLQKQAR